MKHAKHLRLATLISTFSVTAATLAIPVTVYQDDFSGDGSGTLNGTTPDISTTGAMWQANAGWADNGAVNPAGASAAHLDLNIEAGKIYTAQATILNNNTQWVAMGFTAVDAADWTILSTQLRHSNLGAVGYAWMLTGVLNGQVAYQGPRAGTTLVYQDTLANDAPITFKTVLDNTGATSIMTFFINDIQVNQTDHGSLFTAATGGIGFSNSGFLDLGATISAFSLTVDAGVEPLAGDTDGDGDVDDSDLGTAFSNYTGPVGDVGKTLADGDTNADGDVDDSDLGLAFSNYTGPLSPAGVPEPASLALLAVGGLLVARRRA